MTKALQGVHLVFHQAAYQDYMLDFSKFLYVNSVSTAMIHEIIVGSKQPAGKNVEKVIVASSQAVYGEGQYKCDNLRCGRHDAGVIQPETRSQRQLEGGRWELLCPACHEPMLNLPLREEYHNPYNAYAISKLAGEMAAVRLGRLHGIPTVALRYSIVQGPRQSLYNQYSGICRIFCLRLLNDLPPIIYEDGLQLRDYTHIKDVVKANLLVARDGRADYQVFNVGSGLKITVQEYAQALSQKMGKDVAPLVPGEFRIGDNRHSVSDVAKLQSLGWQPRHGLEEIFSDYLAWIQEQADLGQYFREAEQAMRVQGVVRPVRK
jgi:dTDP-L-rhamnose 4-epimerase